MRIINDVEKAESKIKTSILEHGYLPQHHFELFLNYRREKENCVFLDAGQRKGVFAYQKIENWRILTDPICSANENLEIIIEAIEFLFKNYKPKKIIFEDITEGLRKKVQAVSKRKPWKVLPPSYSLFWPVMDLHNWTDKLKGKEWKRFRKIRNKFYRENQVVFKKVNQVAKEDLKNLVMNWKKQRKDTDRVHLFPYLRFVDSSFAGFDLVRIMEVNGRISSISGGWRIPNSKNYYSIFGMHDYSLRDIGEVSYLDELAEVKKMGFEKFDLGGSEGGLAQFKNKFHPEFLYRTDTFSIILRR